MDKEEHGIGLDAQDIGVTTNPFADQLQELQAKIRGGFSKLELGFGGAGKGSGQNLTPGSYGTKQRSAIRELAKVNDIELTTHASFSIPGVSGLTQQGYNDRAQKAAVDEIKRAIDFAADTAGGGAVVFHLGEHARPVMEAGMSEEEIIKQRLEIQKKGDEYKPQFLDSSQQRNRGHFGVVDTRTNKVVEGPIDTTQVFYEPVLEDGAVKTYNGGETKPDGSIAERGDPVTRAYTWDTIVAETEEHNRRIKQQGADRDERFLNTKYKDKQITPSEYFRLKQINDQIFQLRGQEAYYRQFSRQGGSARDKQYYLQGIAQVEGQIAEAKAARDSLMSIREFANKEAAKSIAELGMHAIKEQQRAEREQGHKFKKDLYVAPENVFPEQYGGHPEEMKQIIKEGREELARRLKAEKDMSWEDAKKEANNRIKGTFDIAHFNLFKKYHTGTKEEYDKWYWEQIKNVKQEETLGHIHISDNLGYNDEHLTPGEGSLPVKELVEEFKKGDVDFVVETGRQGEESYIGAFREFGTPVHGLSRPNKADPWNVIEHSYFGRTASPYFVVGEYASRLGMGSQESFRTWHGGPME